MKKMVVLVCQHLILSILLLSTSTYGLPPPAEEGSSSNNALNNISFQFNVNDGNAAREDFFGEGWAKEERNDADDVDSGREDAALPSPITVTTSVTRIEYVRVTREAVAGGVEGVVAGAADDASERPSPFSPASNQEAVDVVDDEPETRPESRADEVLPGSGDLEPGTSSPITAEDEVTDPQDSAGRQPVFNPYAVPDTPEEKFEIEKSYNIIVSNKIGLRDEMCPICMAAVPLRGMTFTNDQQSEMYSLLQRGLTKWNGFESIRKELDIIYTKFYSQNERAMSENTVDICSMIVKEQILDRVYRQYVNLKSSIRRNYERGRPYSGYRQRREAQRQIMQHIKADRLDMRCDSSFQEHADRLTDMFEGILES